MRGQCFCLLELHCVPSGIEALHVVIPKFASEHIRNPFSWTTKF